MTRRLERDDGDVELDLAYLERTQTETSFRTRRVSRGDIATVRGIPALARVGLPIPDHDANAIRYIGQFEALNAPLIPRTTVAAQLGWKGRAGGCGFDGYLWGHQLIASPGVAFGDLLPSDDIVEIAADHRCEGSYDGWARAIEPLCHAYATPRIAVLGSVAAVLVGPLKTVSAAIEFFRPTSSSKTAHLRLAHSVYGWRSALRTWDTTQVGVERVAAGLTDGPLVLDETSLGRRTGNRNLVQSQVMMIVSGRSRTRGRARAGAMEPARSWRTVLMTSGSSHSANSGAWRAPRRES